jgi:molecular chaperone DnaK (HSP70)
MSEEEGPASRVAIGISFGNSYSSIAWTSSVGRCSFLSGIDMANNISQEGKAEVIANEEGGVYSEQRNWY